VSVLDEVKPTEYQVRVLHLPERWNILLAGGRGGGKTMAALLLLLRHVEQHGDRARVLVVRETYNALRELEDQCDALLALAYRGLARHNRHEHVFRLPNGASIEFGQLASPGDYGKYQGRSFTLLVADEVGNFASAKELTLLKSNLRGPEDLPLRSIWAANPGGRLHTFLHMNFVSAASPWVPFNLEGETWVVAPSTYRDNPHLDQEGYERNIRAATRGDEALEEAWLRGNWNIAKGAFFAGVLDESRQMVPASFPIVPDRSWRPRAALDWGSAAPAVVYLALRSPGVPSIPKGSLVLLDELTTALPDDPNAGLGWPPSKLAEATIAMFAKHGIRYVEGVGDDAYGIDDNLLDVLRRFHIHLVKPQKQRIGGWQRMREMLHAAKCKTGHPGLYVHERCRYWWETVPYLPRNPRAPEDVDTTAPDHAADATRYAVMDLRPRATQGTLIGDF